MEADDSTTDNDLNGTGTATQGDWVTGTSYPIIDDVGNIFDDYAGAYYPTIYTICPNRILTETGQVSAEEHAAIFQANSCAGASVANDPALLEVTSATVFCPGEAQDVSVQLMNLGLDNLTFATLGVYAGGELLQSTFWTGNNSPPA